VESFTKSGINLSVKLGIERIMPIVLQLYRCDHQRARQDRTSVVNRARYD